MSYHEHSMGTTIEGLPVSVSYDFNRGYPAQTQGPVDICYPGVDDEIEINSVVAITTDKGECDILPALSKEYITHLEVEISDYERE